MPAVTQTTATRATGHATASPPAAVGAPSPPAAMLVCTLAIPALPEHVHAARAFTELVLGVHDIDDGGIAILLASELVTNSVVHSDSAKPGGTVTIAVAIAPGGVRIEVTDDGGGGEPVPRDAGDEGENGRGLHLVQELADAWGHIAAGGRLTTWFELTAPDRKPADDE